MKVQLGALITDARGAIGGQVIQKGNGGLMMCQKTNELPPKSLLQTNSNGKFRQCITAWRDVTASERNVWNSLSQDYPRTDQFGNTYYLSGYQIFMLVNRRRLHLGLSILTAPTPRVTPTALLLTNQTKDANYWTSIEGNIDLTSGYIMLYTTKRLNKHITNVNQKF